MKRYNATAFLKFDSAINGNAFVNGNVTVYLSGTKIKASLFSDAVGAAKSNPVKTDSNGQYWFYINPVNVDIVINEGNPGTNTIFDEPMLGDSVVNVKSFGAIGDGVTDDTAAIQAAYDYAIANANFANNVTWPNGGLYAITQINIKSIKPINTFAYGAYIKLLTSGSAGVVMQGATHKWLGGKFVSNSALISFLPRAFDLTQSAGFDQSNGVTIKDVDIIDVHQGIRAFMDVGAFTGKTNYRHRIINCFIRNTTNGTKTWSGSYGIRLDGDVAKNSSGNDTKIIGGLIDGFEDGLYTNGEQTNLIGLSIDGCANALHEDATHYTSWVNGYSEFNDFNYKYSNNPTDTLSIGVSFSSQQTGFSTGTHGTGGTFGKHLLTNCIGTGATLGEMGPVTFNSNTGEAVTAVSVSGSAALVDSTSGKQITFKSNGTENGSIKNGLLGMGTASPSGQTHEIYRNPTQDAGNNTFKFGHSSNPVIVYAVSGTGANAANAAMKIPKDSATSRSINAGGTVNASGADYAEYMYKSDDCGVIAKGDICGINSSGKLTDKYLDAITFVIKSTDPSYVGGDIWKEGEREKVDRIAFCGQVPVNVNSGVPGDYLIPINNNGKISGYYVKNPSFDEYRICIGRLISDNTVIVKIS